MRWLRRKSRVFTQIFLVRLCDNAEIISTRGVRAVPHTDRLLTYDFCLIYPRTFPPAPLPRSLAVSHLHPRTFCPGICSPRSFVSAATLPTGQLLGFLLPPWCDGRGRPSSTAAAKAKGSQELAGGWRAAAGASQLVRIPPGCCEYDLGAKWGSPVVFTTCRLPGCRIFTRQMNTDRRTSPSVMKY